MAMSSICSSDFLSQPLALKDSLSFNKRCICLGQIFQHDPTESLFWNTMSHSKAASALHPAQVQRPGRLVNMCLLRRSAKNTTATTAVALARLQQKLASWRPPKKVQFIRSTWMFHHDFSHEEYMIWGFFPSLPEISIQENNTKRNKMILDHWIWSFPHLFPQNTRPHWQVSSQGNDRPISGQRIHTGWVLWNNQYTRVKVDGTDTMYWFIYALYQPTFWGPCHLLWPWG